MNILMIGGTRFLGRHLTQAFLQKGHTVTLFNRGQFDAELFPECAKIQGDRNNLDDLQQLKGHKWDAVIDTCGYFPRQVKAMAETLHSHIPFYCFISSISVYQDQSISGLTEEAPVAQIDDPSVEIIDGAYGALKALCEQTVQTIYGSRSLIIRPGLIVGPYDYSDRFTYWPFRISQGGEVLAPGKKEAPVKIIDARDLSEWIVRLTEQSITGVFHAPGSSYTMEEVLEACKYALESDASFVWMDENFLISQGVEEWMEMPLWIYDPNYKGMQMVNDEKARNYGYVSRPLQDTIIATQQWNDSRGLAEKNRKAGMKRSREIELLTLWHNSKNSLI